MKIYPLFLLFYCGFVFAQDHDALVEKYRSYRHQDTVRCNLLVKLIDAEDDFKVWRLYNNELESITASQLAKPQSEVLINYYRYHYGNSQYNKAYIESTENDLKAGIISAKRALRYHQTGNHYPEISADLNILAYNYQSLGYLNEGLRYYNESIKAAQQAGDDELLTTALHNLSEVYLSKSNYAKGIELQFKILKIAEKLQEPKGIADGLSSIGGIYLTLTDSKKAQIYLDKALKIYQTINHSNGIATVYYHFAEIARIDKNYPEALRWLFESDRLENGARKNKTYAKIGLIYFIQKDYDHALLYYNKALKVIEKSENLNDLSEVYNEIGRVHLARNNHAKAAVYLQKAIGLAEKVKANKTLISAYGLLAQAAADGNDFKKSLYYFRKSTALKDSLAAVDSKNVLLQADFDYETQKKEAQINALSQQKKISELEHQRQIILLTIVVAGLVLVVAIVILQFKRFKAAKENEMLKRSLLETEKTFRAEMKATESELKALKSQMNPHFIFNALNAIQQEFMYGDKRAANEQMGNFTALTRQILTVSGKKKIPLATEIDLLEKYLELEKMRFDSDFSYTISVAPDIDDQYVNLAPMLLQPLVENCIKHGLLHKKGKKEIAISFALDHDQTHLICEIEDNGIGRKKSAEFKSHNKHNSFSTDSIRQRLQLLNQTENGGESLQYEDLTDESQRVTGTKVIVKMVLLD